MLAFSRERPFSVTIPKACWRSELARGQRDPPFSNSGSLPGVAPRRHEDNIENPLSNTEKKTLPVPLCHQICSRKHTRVCHLEFHHQVDPRSSFLKVGFQHLRLHGSAPDEENSRKTLKKFDFGLFGNRGREF